MSKKDKNVPPLPRTTEETLMLIRARAEKELEWRNFPHSLALHREKLADLVLKAATEFEAMLKLNQELLEKNLELEELYLKKAAISPDTTRALTALNSAEASRAAVQVLDLQMMEIANQAVE